MIKIIFCVILCLFFSCKVVAQQKDSCQNFVELEAYTPKDTIHLKTGEKIYYLNNCDSIFTVLQQPYQNFIVHALDGSLAPYYFRLGFFMVKEFENAILFQTDCPAMGPCMYGLLSKDFGLVYQNFEGLIYDGHDDSLTSKIIYFTPDNYMAVYDVNTQQEIKFIYPANRFTSPFPESQINNVKILNNEVVINYNYLDSKNLPKADEIRLKLK